MSKDLITLEDTTQVPSVDSRSVREPFCLGLADLFFKNCLSLW